MFCLGLIFAPGSRIGLKDPALHPKISCQDVVKLCRAWRRLISLFTEESIAAHHWRPAYPSNTSKPQPHCNTAHVPNAKTCFVSHTLRGVNFEMDSLWPKRRKPRCVLIETHWCWIPRFIFILLGFGFPLRLEPLSM
jgi:hypothetical protein